MTIQRRCIYCHEPMPPGETGPRCDACTRAAFGAFVDTIEDVTELEMHAGVPRGDVGEERRWE